ncbi:hypothetical protein EW146_g2505 [Bondarzewia mesenterica]|uniref:Methyltransferase type 11 domain-containing protein n=1 Tax=Bondarzewia mesenterica TaxID=1095465 RepID=A0A4S4M0Y1_9AGAM|nr:hypothetical protein EW146_g2505 [Bondarzewia mesenterica]
MSSSNKVTLTVVDEDPSLYEAKHVHEVYDQIASHFSSTRYKPWPIIAQFLSDLPCGWVGLDSGTGNGKYLPLPLDRPGSVWTIGLDRSCNLLTSARSAGGNDVLREVVWGDVLGKGWRRGAFVRSSRSFLNSATDLFFYWTKQDYAISIATIHHLATPERRKAAVQRLLECISPDHGRVLIYVWAIEQDELSKRTIPIHQPESAEPERPPTTKGQDVFVPWMLTTDKPRDKAKGRKGPKTSSHVNAQTEKVENATTKEIEPKQFDRYYHMFAKGELLDLACQVARDMGLRIGPRPSTKTEGDKEKIVGVEIVQSGWERSNYYIEIRRWAS